jgi:hypothetical protein
LNAREIRGAATPEADSDESDRCGMASNKGAYAGVWVRFDDGSRRGILYGAIDGQVQLEDGVLRFTFDTVNDGSFLVRVRGKDEVLEKIGQQLTWNQRMVLHPRDGVVGSITVEKVEGE